MSVFMNVPQHLIWMADKLRACEPFYHARYNDGEAIAMGYVEGGEQNCDGHHYFPGLGKRLRECFAEMAQGEHPFEVLLGTIAVTDQEHPAGKVFAPSLSTFDFVTAGEFWCQEEKLEGALELENLCALLRMNSSRVVLVGNESIRQARYYLGASFHSVPATDAWLCDYHWKYPFFSGREDMIYVWCCGFPGKVWSWEIARQHPRTTHIDMGHTFDGVFGNKSRGWMLKDTPMSQFYFNSFAPYVRGFIP